jgi:hypothetical protein
MRSLLNNFFLKVTFRSQIKERKNKTNFTNCFIIFLRKKKEQLIKFEKLTNRNQSCNYIITGLTFDNIVLSIYIKMSKGLQIRILSSFHLNNYIV